MEETAQVVAALVRLENTSSDDALDWILHWALGKIQANSEIPPTLSPRIFEALSAAFQQEAHQVVAFNLVRGHLTRGRGLLHLLALRLVAGQGGRTPEGFTLLLYHLLLALQEEKYDEEKGDASKYFDMVDFPTYHDAMPFSAVKKEKKIISRSRVRSRRQRSLPSSFPDLQAGKVRQCENLAVFEPGLLGSSEEEESGGRRESQVKIRLGQGFQYYERGDLASDEAGRLEREAEQRPPRPQTLPLAATTRSGATILLLDLALKVSKSEVLSGGEALDVVLVLIRLRGSSEDRKELALRMKLLLNCLMVLRFRPDLVLPHLENLTSYICPLIARDLGQPEALNRIYTAVLQGFERLPGDEDSPKLDTLLIALVSVLQHIDAATSFLCKILQLTLRLPLSADQKREVFHLVETLPLSAPSLRLHHLTSLVPVAIDLAPETLSPFLEMIEALMNNLAEEEEEEQNGMKAWMEEMEDSKSLQSDSALATSGEEEEIDKKEESVVGFKPYLNILLHREQVDDEVFQHLERLVLNATAATKHTLAVQVILPFLTTRLESYLVSEDSTSLYKTEMVLDLLCSLVSQQPTAMSLIKKVPVWRKVKQLASAPGHLSRVSQDIIKTIVLSSNKFNKIKLSEAEAMALQDDESDVINFDQRDQNAQFWIFKQLYQVLVQSSIQLVNSKLASTTATSMFHLVSAWRISLGLVKQVPDFLVFALERGVVRLAQQLVGLLLSDRCESAEMFGALLSFLIFLTTSKEKAHPEVSGLSSVIEHWLSMTQEMIEDQNVGWKWKRNLLAKLLEGSTEGKITHDQELSLDSEPSTTNGYDADLSDVAYEDKEKSMSTTNQRRVYYPAGLRFYCRNLVMLMQQRDRHYYSLEYLLFQLVKLCKSDADTLLIVTEEFMSDILHHFAEKPHKAEDQTSLAFSSLVEELVRIAASVYLPPEAMRQIFSLLTVPGALQRRLLVGVCNLLIDASPALSYNSTPIASSRQRPRISSGLSSDSGLDSSCSQSSTCPPPTAPHSSKVTTVKDADLDSSLTIVVRLRIESEIDEWSELLTLAQRGETLTIQANVKRGLKLSLANNNGTVAEAQTNLQNMLVTGQWQHLVLNLGSRAEGVCTTRTLSAFIDCCLAWEVGLSLERREEGKQKSGDSSHLVFRLGPLRQNTGTAIVDASDIFLLADHSWGLEDVLQDFLLDSRHLLQPSYCPRLLNLRRVAQVKNANIAKACSRLAVCGERDQYRLVAHIAPGSCNSWSLLPAMLSSLGMEAFLLLPAAAVEAGMPDETIALAWNACLAAATASQSNMDDFLAIGGFPLLERLLTMEDYVPGPLTIEAILQQTGVPALKLLLFPELIHTLLRTMLTNTALAAEFLEPVMHFINQYFTEDNPWIESNLLLAQTSLLPRDASTTQIGSLSVCLSGKQAFLAILACYKGLAGEGIPLPLQELASFLSSLPPDGSTCRLLLACCLLLAPPHLLYLSRTANPVQESFLEIVHAEAVVDVTTAIPTPLKDSDEEQKRQSIQIDQNAHLDLSILGQEEDVVGDWQVVPDPDTEDISQSIPTPPLPPEKKDMDQLLAMLLELLLSCHTVLPDSAAKDLFPTPALLPLLSHPRPIVHAPAIYLLGQVLQRSPSAREALVAHNGVAMLANLLRNHNISQQSAEAVFTLLHQHPVDLATSFELDPSLLPPLDMSMARLVPALLSSTTEVSLCHNLLTRVHELAAHVPTFLDALLSFGLGHALLSLLLQLGDQPGDVTDMGCGFESDLLLEDVHNLLRLVMVRRVELPRTLYEEALDLLFFASSLCSSTITPLALDNIRVAVCVLLEEGLDSLQKALSPRSIFRPASASLEGDFQGPISREPRKVGKRNKKENHQLLARFNQLCKFGVNFISDCASAVQLEEGNSVEALHALSLALLNMWLDTEVQHQGSSDILIKGLQDKFSLPGVVLLHLLQAPTMPRRQRIALVRKVDEMDIVPTVEKMFPTPTRREAFRLALGQLAGEAGLLCSADSDLVINFYGKILGKRLFPKGPGNDDPESPVHHSSFGPWMAEKERCHKVESAKAAERAGEGTADAEKITGEVVKLHDELTRQQLDLERGEQRQKHKATEKWLELVQRQTSPLGPWHNTNAQPDSLVLENISGTSRIFTRLKYGYAGLNDSRFYHPEAEHKSQEVFPLFKRLTSQKPEGRLTLSDRLGGLDQVITVESAQQVTATSCQPGELVITSTQVCFVAEHTSWGVPITKIESIQRMRYQLKEVALEMFLSSGEAHLIVLASRETRESTLKLIEKQGVASVPSGSTLSTLTKQWRQGLISNFHYLVHLNRLAGRTQNDLMQYPVFPWILADYTSEHLDLGKMETFRNLQKPIAVQKDGSEEKYRENYATLKEMGVGLGPYHFASHYSNTGIVLHYLVRLPPFTGEFIKFQDGNFDLPDRSFHSLSTSWKMASETSASDVKELIPELFYLSELLKNNEKLRLGTRQNGSVVNDVELPPWSGGDSRTFVRVHRQALEAPRVRAELAHWIDLVFGYKQKGTAALEACNVFHPATYPGEVGGEDDVEQQARQTMVETYGQTPVQLFFSPHPLPVEELVESESEGPLHTSIPVMESVRGLAWGTWVGSPDHPAPYIVWQQAQDAPVISLISMESNDIIGLHNRAAVLANDKHGVGWGVSGAVLITWGHPTNILQWKDQRNRAEGQQVVGGAYRAWEPPSCGVSHPLVANFWLGHTSGLVSVFPITCRSPPRLGTPTQLHAHSATLSSILLSPQFGLAVSVDQDGLLVSWDLHSLQERRYRQIGDKLDGKTGIRAAISPTSGDIAVGWDGHLHLLNVNLEPVVQANIGKRISSLAFSNQEEGIAVNCVAVGLHSGVVRLYSGFNLQLVREVAGLPSAPVISLAYSWDSRNLVVATNDGQVTILEKSGSKGTFRTPKYLTLQ